MLVTCSCIQMIILIVYMAGVVSGDLYEEMLSQTR